MSLALLLKPSTAPAHAHLVETGFGAFYDGIAHFALTVPDLLLVVALALLAGQRGTQAARWTLFMLPTVWLAGGLAGAQLPFQPDLPLLTTLLFGAAGALVALNAALPAVLVAVFAGIAGLSHGYVNGASMAPEGASVLGLAGVVTAVFCVLAILSAQVATLRAGWTVFAVRVAGSWIAAAGLLMVGWLLRPVT